jgi:hypothetical protein
MDPSPAAAAFSYEAQRMRERARQLSCPQKYIKLIAVHFAPGSVLLLRQHLRSQPTTPYLTIILQDTCTYGGAAERNAVAWHTDVSKLATNTIEYFCADRCFKQALLLAGYCSANVAAYADCPNFDT